MAEHFLHGTKTGERWDHLAHRYYGDATRLTPIIRANRAQLLASLYAQWRGTPPAVEPHLPLLFASPATVTVPVIEEATISAEQLPPWKR